mgnify:FL=1
MERKLIRAYLGALYLQARHARTFEEDALELAKEIGHKGVDIGEIFEAIDRNPSPGFEAHLKREAHRLLREKLTK